MSKLKVHFQTSDNRLRCAYAGERSPKIEEVTCCNCLRRYKKATEKTPPKPPSQFRAISFTLPLHVWEKVQKIPRGERSEWLSNLIEKT